MKLSMESPGTVLMVLKQSPSFPHTQLRRIWDCLQATLLKLKKSQQHREIPTPTPITQLCASTLAAPQTGRGFWRPWVQFLILSMLLQSPTISTEQEVHLNPRSGNQKCFSSGTNYFSFIIINLFNKIASNTMKSLRLFLKGEVNVIGKEKGSFWLCV